MKTNELKKGDWIVLQGTFWRGQVMDNMRGNTRVVDVYGQFHETGSVYSHDILYKIVPFKKGTELDESFLKDESLTSLEAIKASGGFPEIIRHTDAQKKLRKLEIEAIGREHGLL